MLKNIIYIFTLSLSSLCLSQIQNGVIQYKISENKIFEDNKLSFLASEEDKKIAEEVILELKFDENQSLFCPLNLNNYSLENFYSGLTVSHVNGYYYKNNNQFINHLTDDRILGKINVKYDANLNWTLSNETKNIAGYTCYKATSTFTDYNFLKNPITEVMVWYCPEINISLGPKKLGGLPGLILESTERGVTISISKITLNTKNKIDFNLPFETKEITPKEYKKLLDDYIDEMNNAN
jgi:GLPGLI family protein